MPNSVASSISSTLSSISTSLTSPRSNTNKFLVRLLIFIIIILTAGYGYMYFTGLTRKNEISNNENNHGGSNIDSNN